MAVPSNRPLIRRADLLAVLNSMVADLVGPGELSRAFSREFPAWLGHARGLAFAEHTRAASVALRILELAPGARVGIPALARVEYWLATEDAGLTPVALDVDEHTAQPDPELVARSELAALVLDGRLGLAPGSALLEIGLPVLEDITESLGSTVDETAAGSRARIAVMGLGADAVITAGGGAVLSLRTRKDHAALSRESARLGTSSLMSDMNAALATAQLRELGAMLGRRKEIAGVLLEQARRAGRSVLLPPGEGLLPFSLALRVQRGAGEVIAYAARQEVSAAPAFENSVVARGLVGEDETPIAARLAMSCVRFPLYPAMTNDELSQVARVVATLP